MPEDKKEEYNALQYPEGVDRVEEEMLGFLPDDKQVKDLFMNDILQWLIQW